MSDSVKNSFTDVPVSILIKVHTLALSSTYFQKIEPNFLFCNRRVKKCTLKAFLQANALLSLKANCRNLHYFQIQKGNVLNITLVTESVIFLHA